MPIKVKRVLKSKLKNILMLLGDPKIEIVQGSGAPTHFYVRAKTVKWQDRYGNWYTVEDLKDFQTLNGYAKPDQALAAWADKLSFKKVRAGRWPFCKYVDLTSRKVVM